MNNEKILSISLIIITFAIYFCYNNFEEKKRLKSANAELTNQINQLEQTISRNNQIIADNELSKRELEKQSLERQEQINEQLKDNDCAKQFVPMPVSASLYNRAKGIRESTYNSQSIK